MNGSWIARRFRRHLKYLCFSPGLKPRCRYLSTKMSKSRQCKVGLIQLCSTSDKEASFTQAVELIEQAQKDGARVVFLPEACDFIGHSRDFTMASAESLKGETIKKYKEVAKKLDVWISLGGLHIKSNLSGDERISNMHVMLNGEGEVSGTYAKTHLFNVEIPGRIRLKETDFTRPGTSIGPPVLTPAGKVGLAIVLMRARAIENQCYVVSAAQVGAHNPKRSSYGHAMVVDPWGTILSNLGDDIGYSVVEIDLDGLYKRREEMPVMEHRRYDLYGSPHLESTLTIDSIPVYQFGQVTVPASCVFYRSALSFAFVNRKPVLAGHVLVSPVRSVPRYDDLTKSEIADLAITVQKVSQVIEKHYGGKSRTIGLQDGPEAGQSIKLEMHDKNVAASEWRTEEEMSAEAATLRQLFI